MSGDQTASLFYLALLGLAIAGWHFAANRRRLGQMAQQAAVWAFIFLGAIVSVGLWQDIRGTVLPQQSSAMGGTVIEVPMARDGHFYLTLTINGQPLPFVVDTGASDIVLSAADAARVGVDPDRMVFSGRATTANGIVETAPVRLDRVELEGVVDENVPAVVNAGELRESLLGMSYLRRFDRLEISDRRLLLER